MCIALPLCAQQPHEQTNAGTDFWVTDVVASYIADDESLDYSEQIFPNFEFYLHYPDNYSDTATILIVGNSPCSGYAENVNTGWRTDFQVTPGAMAEIKVPEEEIMCYINQGIQQKGIYVHTESEVYAYLITRLGRTWNWYSSVIKNTPQKFPIPPVQVGVKEARLPVSLGITHSDACCTDVTCMNEFMSLSYLVVGMEDNTDVTVSGHYEASAPLYDTSTNVSVVWIPDVTYTIQKGEVLVIPFVCSENGPIHAMNPPRAMDMEFHTNCKMVSVYQHRTFRASYISDAMPYESVAPYHPDLFGKDFLDTDFIGCTVTGRLQSRQCHGMEDAPKFSHRIYYDENNNMQSEHDICQCSPSFAYSVFLTVAELWGTLKFIYNNNPLMPTEMVAINRSSNIPYQCIAGPITQLFYADKQVKEVIFPIQHFVLEGRVILFIATSPQGRFTTFVNGTLMPDSLFVIDDPQVGQYYVAALTYENHEIPEVIRIENTNGFSAQLQEIRRYDYPSSNLFFATTTISNSGCTYDPSPIHPNIGTGVTTFCANDTLRVYTEGNCENYPITWTVDDSTFTLFDEDVLVFPFSVVDTLHLTMVVEKHCPDTLIDTVYVVLQPHLTLPADTIICRGASVTAQSDMFGFFHWSDGTEGATFTPQEEGDYTVRIDNACGSDSATIRIRFYDTLHVDFGNDTLLCELATLLLDATQEHPASYLWQDFSTNTTYTVINDGRYWVIVTDGCAGVSDTVDVTYLYDLQIDLGPDTTVCSDRPYTLDVTTPYSYYLWHDGTTAPTHEVTAPGTYSVHVYNVCTEADASVTIEVEDCEEMVHVPNAFTPNGDGQNDLFLPVFNHPERLESYSMQVYDRWGRLLFSTDNPQQGWDCSECPVGVYVWRMEYKAAGEGSKLLTGSVTVVR